VVSINRCIAGRGCPLPARSRPRSARRRRARRRVPRGGHGSIAGLRMASPAGTGRTGIMAGTTDATAGGGPLPDRRGRIMIIRRGALIRIMITTTTSQPYASQTWYYCSDPAGYYPYVTQCNTGWQAVLASLTRRVISRGCLPAAAGRPERAASLPTRRSHTHIWFAGVDCVQPRATGEAALSCRGISLHRRKCR
jgi:hypothetical protein